MLAVALLVDADRDWLFELHRDAYRDVVVRQFGGWEEDRQRRMFRDTGDAARAQRRRVAQSELGGQHFRQNHGIGVAVGGMANPAQLVGDAVYIAYGCPAERCAGVERGHRHTIARLQVGAVVPGTGQVFEYQPYCCFRRQLGARGGGGG